MQHGGDPKSPIRVRSPAVTFDGVLSMDVWGAHYPLTGWDEPNHPVERDSWLSLIF